ncbi:glycosyltransferase family 4 protein [Nisaea acidiphila]|uniref:Glycosyltransferase family 4 protein n=1 Tax=Nisaea acidiphila TaxID=1862145 RepID=A0A9J7ARJ1_9PROT|nr:glycosyltransferase family 4 protein [Nisaea acidiphila]UUX49984.1 glycosyltransferase family 4 protein [Nisaea acidiphila]
MTDALAPVSIFVAGSSGFGVGANPFGKDIANIGLFRAIARYSRAEGALNFVDFNTMPEEVLRSGLSDGKPLARKVTRSPLFDLDTLERSGCLLRGSADISDLAWTRRSRSDRAFSIVGLVHTLAPPGIREYVARCAISPIQPWDALICTSPAVKQGLEQMFGELNEFAAARLGVEAARSPMPHLPVIPLGVDAGTIEANLAVTGGRDAARAALSITEDEVVVLWVGRLSFYEKARPSPMFQAVEAAAKASGKKIRFIMAGWFPNPEEERGLYQEAAQAHAPSVTVEFVDGNDRHLLDRCWAGADIFLSLVDNIQETFGITPLEAMAAGLPVVLSDWDGYRSTVRDQIEGFQIPTLFPRAGNGGLMVDRHVLGLDSYQQYVSVVGQHTAVNVDAAAAAIARLASDPGLRTRMGEAGRERVRNSFDWPVVVSQLDDLWEELAERRNSAQGYGENGACGRMGNPVKGDPFHAFRHFPTATLGPDTVLRVSPEGRARLATAARVNLDARLEHWRAPAAEQVLTMVEKGGEIRFADIARVFGVDRNMKLELLVAWMCKYGILDFN